AEDLHSGGMSVAFGIAAGGSILNGVDDAKGALAIGEPVGAKVLLDVGDAQRVPGHGSIMGLHVLVHVLVHLGGIGRKADAALIIDDADADHSGLIRHFGDDVIEAIALIAQHVVGGVALD